MPEQLKVNRLLNVTVDPELIAFRDILILVLLFAAPTFLQIRKRVLAGGDTIMERLGRKGGNWSGEVTVSDGNNRKAYPWTATRTSR